MSGAANTWVAAGEALGLPGPAPLGSDLVPNVISVSPGYFQPCPQCQKVELLLHILTENEVIL